MKLKSGLGLNTIYQVLYIWKAFDYNSNNMPKTTKEANQSGLVNLEGKKIIKSFLGRRTTKWRRKSPKGGWIINWPRILKYVKYDISVLLKLMKKGQKNVRTRQQQ